MLLIFFSDLVLVKLTAWANKEIFQGGLSIEKPLNEDVNAGAVTYRDNPKKAKIIITMGMLFEIYRDCMVFPIYAEKLKRGTNTYDDDVWSDFSNVKSKFKYGIPDVDFSDLTEIGKLLTSSYYKAMNEKSDITDVENKVLINSVKCRFQMFEFMVSWVFFHELSHIIQSHHKLKENKENHISFYEMDKHLKEEEYYDSQAREILADIEGLDLTLQYLKREGSYNYNSFYFVLCAQTCMFNRFYHAKYKEEYFVLKGSHPHPVVRYEYIQDFFSKRMLMDLPLIFNENSIKKHALESIYLSTKSSIIANLFWANRHTNFAGDELPSFMKVQRMNDNLPSLYYKKSLNKHIIPFRLIM